MSAAVAAGGAPFSVCESICLTSSPARGAPRVWRMVGSRTSVEVGRGLILQNVAEILFKFALFLAVFVFALHAWTYGCVGFAVFIQRVVRSQCYAVHRLDATNVF